MIKLFLWHYIWKIAKFWLIQGFNLTKKYEVHWRILKWDYIRYSPSEISTIIFAKIQTNINIPREGSVFFSIKWLSRLELWCNPSWQQNPRSRTQKIVFLCSRLLIETLFDKSIKYGFHICCSQLIFSSDIISDLFKDFKFFLGLPVPINDFTKNNNW